MSLARLNVQSGNQMKTETSITLNLVISGDSGSAIHHISADTLQTMPLHLHRVLYLQQFCLSSYGSLNY